MHSAARPYSLYRRIRYRGATWIRTLTPSICHEGKLLNTMPKSGSAYVENSLSKILGLWTRYHGHRYGLIDQIDIQDAHTFSRGGFVSQNHLAPSPENLQVLRHFKLHLRDLRLALLSWVHYLHYVSGSDDTSKELLYVTPRPPVGYWEGQV
jgi:hypothetical protein